MPLRLLTTHQEIMMPFGTLALYLAFPFSFFLMIQSIPELRGFLDYGTTAGLAAYMVWLWNKHTIRWQDKQEQIEVAHRDAMERIVDRQSELMLRLADRYDDHIGKMTTALTKSAESNERVASAIEWCKNRSKN